MDFITHADGVCLFVCLFFSHDIWKTIQLWSPNLTQTCSTISPGNLFILVSRGQRSRSRGIKQVCACLQMESNTDVCCVHQLCWFFSRPIMLPTAGFSVRGVLASSENTAGVGHSTVVRAGFFYVSPVWVTALLWELASSTYCCSFKILQVVKIPQVKSKKNKNRLEWLCTHPIFNWESLVK